MEIKGVSHPIPPEYAERIYNDGKTVFVGKSYLGKVKVDDKFIVYESYRAKAYTGWAKIKFIGKMSIKDILKIYIDKLMITEEELIKYSKNRKEMNIIEFEKFEKFINPVVPKRFVTVAGKYIYEHEFKFITENKD